MMVLLVAALVGAAPVKKAFSVEEQVRLRRLQGFKPSPDGTKVVLAVRETDMDANRGRVDLWLVGADGSGLRRLTSHPDNDGDALWAPDGKSVFFLSTRGGSAQVWRLSLEGGEPTQVTKSPIDVDSFVLSKDGQWLAFSADTFPDCDTLDCTQKRLDEKAKLKTTGRVYEQLLFRHWDTWKDGRRSHLFVQKVEGGSPVDVTKKLVADAPSKPFGGSDEYTFTPDGKSLVFTARDVGREEAWSTDLDLFVTPIDGSKPPTKLTTKNRATDTRPVFSPDGTTLAYLAMARPGYEADQLALVLRDWATGKERKLTPMWDRSVDQFAWSKDGATIFISAEHFGQSGLFAASTGSGQVSELPFKGSIGGLAVTGAGLLLAVDDLKRPSDLYSVGFAGGELKALTQLNKDTLEGLKFGDFEQFKFKGAGGDVVYGYLVKPVDFDPKKKYPLAFLIHGGPQGSFGNHFHYRWNPQTYAGRGYVAVMIDFHGSTGYGQQFTDAIRGDWGGKPLDDLKVGLAHVLATYGFVDKERLCALGASYGGYMINWIAGVWNEPWKCLVTHDGNLDEQFAYYDTEELWFPEWEHGGPPFADKSGYVKHNPIDHVAKWRVPMLVVHGGKDFRVVDTQGMATFTAAQRKGVPSKFLHFPDENHWVLKPANSVLWHETVLGWLDQWTGAKR